MPLALSGKRGLKNDGLARSSCSSSLSYLFCHGVRSHYPLGDAVKWLIILPIFLTLLESSQEKKTEYRCVRWAWTGDVYNRKVVCLQWEKVVRR